VFNTRKEKELQVGNIIETPPLHSEDLRRITKLEVEKRLLLNQTTFEDLDEMALELVHLFADRFRELFDDKKFSAEKHEELKAVGPQQARGCTRIFHRREKNAILLRAFHMDKWAEPSWFAKRYWYPLKAELGWNQWMNSDPLKLLIRTDDPLFMLDEYDAWIFAGEQLAQLWFGFLDNVKSGKIKAWDESKWRVNCFGDDMIGGIVAAAAAKIIRDILLPEEEKNDLLRRMREDIAEKLAEHGLTIRDIVLAKREHEGRWIEDLSEEACAIELEGVLRKPEIASGYFSILQNEDSRSPVKMDWGLSQQMCFRFGGIAFTSAAYHIIEQTSILKQIKDEPFRFFVAALIGAGCARIAQKDRDKQEIQYPEKFSRINPFTIWRLECKVAHLYRLEMERRGKLKSAVSGKAGNKRTTLVPRPAVA